MVQTTCPVRHPKQAGREKKQFSQKQTKTTKKENLLISPSLTSLSSVQNLSVSLVYFAVQNPPPFSPLPPVQNLFVPFRALLWQFHSSPRPLRSRSSAPSALKSFSCVSCISWSPSLHEILPPSRLPCSVARRRTLLRSHAQTFLRSHPFLAARRRRICFRRGHARLPVPAKCVGLHRRLSPGPNRLRHSLPHLARRSFRRNPRHQRPRGRSVQSPA